MSSLIKTYPIISQLLAKNEKKSLKILVQRADRLGDVVFSLPVIEKLKEQYPNATIDALTSPIGKKILDGHPDLRHVVAYPSKSGVGLNNFGAEKRACLKFLKEQQYDVYLSLWNDPKFARMGKRLGVPIRIGDSTNPSLKWFYTHPVEQHWRDFTKHQIDFNLELLKPLGIDVADYSISMPIQKEAKKTAKQWVSDLKKQSKKRQPVVLVFAGTGGSNAPIPEDTIIATVHALIHKQNVNVILCGEGTPVSLYGNADKYRHSGLPNAAASNPDNLPSPKLPRTPIERVKHNQLLNLIGKTTIPELVALIDASTYYIGADTGPSHIAAFLDKPMLFFCGRKPNSPSRFGPVASCFRIIRKDYTCPHFCQKRACDSGCFPYLTPQLLEEEFVKLREDFETKKIALNQRSKETKLQLESIRVMYLCWSIRDFEKSKSCIEALQKKGLIVFPYVLNKFGFFHMLSFAMKKNINVIQSSKNTRLYAWFIQMYLGVIKQYIRPIFVNVPFVAGVKHKEYLNIYKKQWEKIST